VGGHSAEYSAREKTSRHLANAPSAFLAAQNAVVDNWIDMRTIGGAQYRSCNPWKRSTIAIVSVRDIYDFEVRSCRAVEHRDMRVCATPV